MKIDYTELFQALITLLSAIITGFLIPFLKRKISEQRLEELRKWVAVAVEAAEQLYSSKTGLQKKEYVVSFLLSKGIVFDVEEVTALIESEVYKLTRESEKTKP